ncbi:anthranilate phosphoribosyltransferase [Chengkuizengella sediminis]|uniref:anthranilate phosphoribosyltransferase n=1 Tax=Chengkuizengella sediminis TaxID=1885917 RepID=UPI001389F2C3|nr:anthranilate phosphoribosyltransferase [Chengkuizengella sediminis]NDI34361.1 anthranilate phosphoribosyltransferase [Chengkuizengella sediminis]
METNVIKDVLSKLLDGNHLSKDEARQVMEEMMEGRATGVQIGSLLTALRIKGETIEEVTGFAETMRSKSYRVQTTNHPLLDTCGTGGDGANTFNISTASAIVAAAGNIRVAKHGNRAMSSKSGSADVLEALGVNINLDHNQAQICIDHVGICFMFAQKYHESMKNVATPRRELGFRTVFNMLGPLTNPANADRQLMGVFDRSKTELIASVLRELDLERALVVSSYDGLDEISISAPTQVSELKGGIINTYDITPDDLGLEGYPVEEIAGGDALENAEIIRSVFKGEKGARRNIILANAGACFYVFDHCSSLQEGVKIAANIIDSGEAFAKLEELVQFTKEISHDS